MISLDQQRAAAAYRAIEEKPATAERAQKLPAMIQTNGLLATWAFLLSKKETAVLDATLGHLRTSSGLDVPQQGDAKAAFLHWVGGATGTGQGVATPELRRLTAEVLALSVWLKRAAEAREKTPDNDHGDDNAAP